MYIIWEREREREREIERAIYIYIIQSETKSTKQNTDKTLVKKLKSNKKQLYYRLTFLKAIYL